jgi:hypothetical protein
MSCINGYKRHLPNKEQVKRQDILICTRCGKTKYELDNGAVQWLAEEDLPKEDLPKGE